MMPTFIRALINPLPKGRVTKLAGPKYFQPITQPNGLVHVLNNLYVEIEKIEDRTLAGLIQAAKIIHKSMDESWPPLVPEDIGNLRQSYFCVTSKGKIVKGYGARFRVIPKGMRKTAIRPYLLKRAARIEEEHFPLMQSMADKAEELGKTRGPTVIFGFSAYYALYVHEMIEGAMGRIFWTRRGSGAQFFAKAIAHNKNKVLECIVRNASTNMPISQRHW